MNSAIILSLLSALNNPIYSNTLSNLTREAIIEGSASGEMQGELIKEISGLTRSLEPVMLRVDSIRKYKQFGCARLNYTLMQEKVLLKNGNTTKLSTSWQMNICEDGKPPKDLN